MNDRNNSAQSEKQKELMRRLEEIRRQRGTTTGRNSESNEARGQSTSRQTTQTSRRNEGQQQERPSRPSQKRPQRQDNPYSRKKPDGGMMTQTTYRQQSTIDERDPIASSDSLSDLSKIRDTSQTIESSIRKKPQSKTANNVVKQLSQGDSLAQAIILNEVLSKPIALRKKYR